MLIFDPATDPAFNLAAEEFLLKETEGPVLRLWRNDACVVIGRHQIPCMEVNVTEAARLGIPVVRRLSGGGAVYHDPGNLNFSVFGPVSGGIDFDRLLTPLVRALDLMGIKAEHVGRGDVRLNGSKISGNAAYLWRGRLLHHGTLLYDASLDALEGLLEVRKDAGWKARGTPSVRSPVVNIATLTDGRFGDCIQFANALADVLAPMLGEKSGRGRSFTESERERIAEIAAERYRRLDWNLGGSPNYALDRVSSDGIEIHFSVVKGRMDAISARGSDPNLCEALRTRLQSVWHEPESVAAALADATDIARMLLPVGFFF